MIVHSTTMRVLRRFALQLPETDEGIACEGTALESVTVKRKNKAFLFLRATEARLKLASSLPEAAALSSQEPTRYTVGAHGWVLATFDSGAVPLDVLKRWIEESYSLLGGRTTTSATSGSTSRKVKKRSGKAK
jgi:YjbR